jgi:septal ring factor EnvC (AmiA/AmiB activator)
VFCFVLFLCVRSAAMEEKEGLQAQLRAMMEDTKQTLAELDAKERTVAERESAFAQLQEQYEATRTVQEQLKASVSVAEGAMRERMEEAAAKEAVGKNVIFGAIYMQKRSFLPGQAQDKHGKGREKRAFCFCAGARGDA